MREGLNIFELIEEIHKRALNDKKHKKQMKKFLKGMVDIKPGQYTIDNISSKDHRVLGN